MAKKFYVVWKGAQTGIFDSWPQTKALIDGRADAQYMGFPSKESAEQAFNQSYTQALINRSKEKGASTSKPTETPAKSASSAPVKIYSDGACSPNPGQSGTGIAIYEHQQLTALWFGLYNPMGTNNTAELNGLLQSLRLAEQYLNQYPHVEVLSDSRYSIDCITKWARGWQAKGWKRGGGEEIKNLDIIQQCFQLYQQLKSKLTVSYVKGHANIEGNELADRMAVHARITQTADWQRFNGTKDIQTILAMPSG